MTAKKIYTTKIIVNKFYSRLLKMSDEKLTNTHTFQLVRGEQLQFERAFELSGFRSKSEFIRFCLFCGIKELYGDK